MENEDDGEEILRVDEQKAQGSDEPRMGGKNEKSKTVDGRSRQIHEDKGHSPESADAKKSSHQGECHQEEGEKTEKEGEKSNTGGEKMMREVQQAKGATVLPLIAKYEERLTQLAQRERQKRWCRTQSSEKQEEEEEEKEQEEEEEEEKGRWRLTEEQEEDLGVRR